jgi:hypothetical protein
MFIENGKAYSPHDDERRDQVLEIIKCIENPMYFLTTYCYTYHPVNGFNTLEHRDYQERIVNSIRDEQHNIICASRQIGKTTLLCGMALWQSIFSINMPYIGLLTVKDAAAKDMLGIVKSMHDNLPVWLQAKVEICDSRKIHFQNGATIHASRLWDGALKGSVYSHVFIDEMAYVNENDMEEFYNSNFPVLMMSSKITIASTPNGVNKFRTIWFNSRFKSHRVYWWEVPNRDNKWRLEMINNIGKQAFSQEYSCHFEDLHGSK